MSGSLGELVVSLSADLARFQSDMGKSVSIVDKASKEMASVLGIVPKAINLIGSAAAMLGGGKLFGNIISETVQWNSQARKLANTFGITTQEASIFGMAIDDIGISQETAVNAALKLSRTLSQGTDKFDEYGVKVKDANGNLLPIPEIMANVNKGLLETKAGTDRNIMALSLYGRSWGEMAGILKLTPAKLSEAQREAEKLHMLVGPEGAEKTRQYKEALNDAQDVVKALKIQIGNELIPELTRLAKSFSEAGQNNMSGFIHGMHSVEAEIMRMAMLLDKLGGTFTAVMSYLAQGFDTNAAKWWRAQNEMYKQRYAETEKELQKLAYLDVGLDENGNPIVQKRQNGASGDTVNPGTKNNTSGDEAAARNSYISYLRSYYETISQIQKQANDAEEQANQIAYNWGLIDLKSYLDTKHRLNENSLQAELEAKKKELAEARKEESEAVKAYNKDGTGGAAAEVHKAYDKTQRAIMAVNDAESKLRQTRTANNDESINKLREQKNLIDDLRISNLALAASIPDVYGNINKQGAMSAQYDQEIANVDRMAELYNKDSEEYRLAQEKKKTITAKYHAEQSALNAQYARDIVQTELGIASSFGELISLIGEDNKGAAIAALAIQKGVAMAEIFISTQAASMRAYADLGPVAGAAMSAQIEALGNIKMAMIGATGIIEAGKIAGGRAEGGPVDAGRTYWVGEKGEPELFTPGSSGMITPASKLGGSVSIVNNYDFTNAAPETEQRLRAEIKRNSEKTKADILSSMNRGGTFALASGRVR